MGGVGSGAPCNFAGRTFGRLVALRRVGTTTRGNAVWELRCACGRLVDVPSSALVKSPNRDCGCESGKFAKAPRGSANRAEYSAWGSMWTRCTNPRHKNYDIYGGRGVRVCPQWASFTTFLADVGDRPSKSHSLDRYPNRDGDYEPGNVRWATATEQNRNRRNGILVQVGDAWVRVDQAAALLGISDGAVRSRIAKGLLVRKKNLTDAAAFAGRTFSRGSDAEANRHKSRISCLQ